MLGHKIVHYATLRTNSGQDVSDRDKCTLDDDTTNRLEQSRGHGSAAVVRLILVLFEH